MDGSFSYMHGLGQRLNGTRHPRTVDDISAFEVFGGGDVRDEGTVERMPRQWPQHVRPARAADALFYDFHAALLRHGYTRLSFDTWIARFRALYLNDDELLVELTGDMQAHGLLTEPIDVTCPSCDYQMLSAALDGLHRCEWCNRRFCADDTTEGE